MTPSARGFVRLVNRSDEAGTVTLRAFDDAGTAYPAQTLALTAGQAMHFSAADLEEGHADKGLTGTGDGAGSWRLVLEPEPADLDLQALSLVRNPDMSSVAALHDTAPGSAEAGYAVAFFNPASNRGLSSRLRLVNRSGRSRRGDDCRHRLGRAAGRERGDVAYPRPGRVHAECAGAGIGRVGGHRAGRGLRSAHRRPRRRRGQVAPFGVLGPTPRGHEPAAPRRLRSAREPLHRKGVRSHGTQSHRRMDLLARMVAEARGERRVKRIALESGTAGRKRRASRAHVEARHLLPVLPVHWGRTPARFGGDGLAQRGTHA